MPLPARRRPSLARYVAACAVLVGACEQAPVEWRAVTTVERAGAGMVRLHADGTVSADTLLALASRVAPPPGPACAGSLRLALARGTLYGVWWSPRPDSGVRLLEARSTDGGRSWSAAAAVDTTDAGVGGCDRAPASIAADSASGYVHVTYGLKGAEGPGLFFSHSMDGGVTFHSPVPILYGERFAATTVAADGDLVVVAFEDPNSSTPRIGLALSRTMGHIFEHRILPVSDDNDRAVHPLAAAHGRSVAVAWEQAGSQGAALAVRAGTVR